MERFVKKGDLIYIEGKITTRGWESDGQKKYMTEIIADNIELLGGKSETKETQSYEPEKAVEDDDVSLPF